MMWRLLVLASFVPLAARSQPSRPPWPIADSARACVDTNPVDDGRPHGTAEHVMLALRGATAAGATILLASDSRAQMAKCARHGGGGGGAYNRDLATWAYDGLCLPRWQHHMLRAYIASTVSDVLREVTDWPAWVCATTATLSVGVAGHLLGYARRDYGFNAPEWAADAWFASYPLVRVALKPQVGTLGAMTVWVGVYYVVYPYASP